MSSRPLIRFISLTDGRTYYGLADKALKNAEVLGSGNPFSEILQPTGIHQPISRLLSPLDRNHCRGIVCVGLNYKDHAKEARMPIPTVPVIFHRPISSLTGPSDDLLIPRASWVKGGLDYEAELVVVIGEKAFRVSEEHALKHVYGYTAGNDFSNRQWQLDPSLGGGQWCYSKCFDSTAPIGPAIVPTSSLGDASNLSIRTKLNGSTMQDSNTDQMIFSVPRIVSFLSQAMTLLPGTLIFTGTPAGVGFAKTPQVNIKDGDDLEIEIEGIGRIFNRVLYAPE